MPIIKEPLRVIPCPPRYETRPSVGRRRLYRFDRIKPGEEMRITGIRTADDLERAYRAAYSYGRTHGMVYQIEVFDHEVRVFRAR